MQQARDSQGRDGGRLRVLVVGAGFGGLTLTRRLRAAPVQVTLLDQNNYHLFTPLLYQVATALLDPSEIAHPVRGILRGQGNARFRMGRLLAVHAAEHRVETSIGDIAYDRLVLAAGSVNNTFGNPSIEEHAFPLKELGDALALRNHVLAAFERAATTADPQQRRRFETIAVVGAGPTGVECSGAFSELSRLVLRRDYAGEPLDRIDTELLEAAPSLLGSFAPSLQRAAKRTLERKGVQVRLSTPVKELKGSGTLVLGDGATVEAATVVWTAGVKASPAGELLGVALDRGGRVPVDEWMRVVGVSDVYAIGDMAAVRGVGGPHPMLAPPAIQQGEHVARQLTAEATGQPGPGPFRYRDKGTMATIGRNSGIAQIGRLRFSGFIGWAMWLVVHLVQIIGFRNRLIVLINWAWDYVLFDRPVRLIAEAKRRNGDNQIP
ncbi:MAG TPA: NAD(P)/FAD-dependent oxidoreductase [Candidatus Dormibacteraeota bacterium]|jgi:NADH dehydrogenase|nr:NAD(P)/FAD-dependent oxidoreductase [Candidatus Dormibacteraeota bacterium]